MHVLKHSYQYICVYGTSNLPYHGVGANVSQATHEWGVVICQLCVMILHKDQNITELSTVALRS